MDVFTLTDIKKYNILGLLAICRHNRDIFSAFNKRPRKLLEQMFIQLLNNNTTIIVPPFIYNNTDYIKHK